MACRYRRVFLIHDCRIAEFECICNNSHRGAVSFHMGVFALYGIIAFSPSRRERTLNTFV